MSQTPLDERTKDEKCSIECTTDAVYWRHFYLIMEMHDVSCSSFSRGISRTVLNERTELIRWAKVARRKWCKIVENAKETANTTGRTRTGSMTSFHFSNSYNSQWWLAPAQLSFKTITKNCRPIGRSFGLKHALHDQLFIQSTSSVERKPIRDKAASLKNSYCKLYYIPKMMVSRDTSIVKQKSFESICWHKSVCMEHFHTPAESVTASAHKYKSNSNWTSERLMKLLIQ